MNSIKRSTVPPDQLRVDAHDLAQRLIDGQGPEALDVIYGGSYSRPEDMAALLEYAAGVARFCSTTRGSVS